MEEMIGNVKLDYSLYSGADLYSDGDIEDEMLKITMEHDEAEYDDIIRERKNWPILYHLSKKRQNIIEWMPFDKNMDILEIGSGCGAITGILAERSGHVTCIELSKKRSLINANRNKKYDNIEIKVGNFKDIEPTLTRRYDYITLIGVLEYAKLYIVADNPYVEFLKTIYSHLKEDGTVVIAIENRLGLKYWAGCQEDHMEKYFIGIEGYGEGDNIQTFTKSELEEICKDAGFHAIEFYYPYPDYKFPERIYTDIYLPKKGELSNNINNLDKMRMLYFQETKAFNSIIEEGLFPQFSNSYLLVLKKENV